MPTTDGSYVAVGYSFSTDGDMAGLNKGSYDAIIVKYDAIGNVLWKKVFGGSGVDEYRSVTQTNNGNYVIVGYSNSANGDLTGLYKGSVYAIIVEYDSSGNVLWKKSFGGSVTDIYQSVIQTVDGGYVAVGNSNSTDGDMTGLSKGSDDAIMVKYQIESVIPTTPVVSASTIIPTNVDVIVTAAFSEDSTLKQLSKDGGAWTDYTDGVVFTKNGTASFKSQNSSGNWSEVATYTVENIDKVPPIAPIIALLAGDSVSLSGYTDASSGVLRAEYRIDGGAWTTYENPVTLIEKSGTEAYIVEARTLDMAGNYSSIANATVTTFKQKLAEVTNKVSVAEILKKQTEIDAARELANALPDGLEKTALLNRLNAINMGPIVVSQEFKLADSKINLAMSLPREPYLSLALLAIDKVTDPMEKAALVAEMQIAIDKSTTTKPVTTKTANLFVRLAEITGRDKHITLADAKTSQINDEAEKQDAITRMDIAKLVKSPAENRVYSALIAAEQWKSTNMITAAKKLINALADSSLKTLLLERINN